MSRYIKLLAFIIFTLFIFSCSNENNGTDTNQTATHDEAANDSNTDLNDSDVVEKYDFRQAKWGMSMEEVMASEKSEPAIKSDNSLDYNMFMMGMQTQVTYTFKDDQLVRAGFYFITKPETQNEYVDNYLKLKEELIKVNGDPVIDAVKQINPSIEIDPIDRGKAVCDGELIYATQWNLPETDIQLVLRGENSDCVLTILYLSDEGVRQLLQKRLNN